MGVKEDDEILMKNVLMETILTVILNLKVWPFLKMFVLDRGWLLVAFRPGLDHVDWFLAR